MLIPGWPARLLRPLRADGLWHELGHYVHFVLAKDHAAVLDAIDPSHRDGPKGQEHFADVFAAKAMYLCLDRDVAEIRASTSTILAHEPADAFHPASDARLAHIEEALKKTQKPEGDGEEDE